MKSLQLFILFLLLSNNAFTQSAIDFITVVRDVNGLPLANKEMNFELGLIEEEIFNSPVYLEQQLLTSNMNGEVQIPIGNGVVQFGDFGAVNFKENTFLSVAIDTAGGDNFIGISTFKFNAIPTAIFAEKTTVNASFYGLNVKDFGAIGDEIHDDTQAFKDAIAYADKHGNNVLVPVGNYKISSTLNITSGITLFGESRGIINDLGVNTGTVLCYYGTDEMIHVQGENCGLKNLSIIDKNGNATHGIKVVGDGQLSERIQVSNIQIIDFENGVALALFTSDNTGAVSYGRFADIDIINCESGILIDKNLGGYPNSNFFEKIYIKNEGKMRFAIKANTGNNNQFHKCKIDILLADENAIFVKQGAEIAIYDLDVLATNQPTDRALIYLQKGTREIFLEGKLEGGQYVNYGNNILHLKSNRILSYQIPNYNQLLNSEFLSNAENSIPFWKILGNSHPIEILDSEIMPGFKQLKIRVAAGEFIKIKPKSSALPKIMKLPEYQELNFGFYARSASPDVVKAHNMSKYGITVSAAHTGDGSWQFVGQVVEVEESTVIQPTIILQNETGVEQIVFITTPTLTFGSKLPKLASKPLDVSGGIIYGRIKNSLIVVNSKLNNKLILPNLGNYFLFTGAGGEIKKLGLDGEKDLDMGTIITLVFQNEGISLNKGGNLKLKDHFVSTANSSISLMSLGNGYWMEFGRNQ